LYLGKIGLEEERANKVTNHSFRHIFITRTGKEKGIHIAQLRVGHKSLLTTEGYFHHTIDEYMKENFQTSTLKANTNALTTNQTTFATNEG